MKGFTIELNKHKYKVFFETWNKRVVKCTIVEFFPPDNIISEPVTKKFVGISKCNIDAGDIFNIKEGQRIAFNKALRKRILHHHKIRYIAIFHINKIMANDRKLEDKFKRIIEKIK